ncbi:hypothetical protein CYY_010010 [Polysphondylium violaceum]|uniref:Proteasome assembly chaperone 2 n=1 Tax=Polysphondylium violaceum TaxID=133409 RepID=A0A8J4PJG8_9MYCE|nr:hypothetical protein CYY_010010 [Polysphondylium violaceum]
MSFFYKASNIKDNVSFKDNILIWPALTLGNVGQLSIDLLICTYKFERVGFIVDSNILPIVGNDTYTPKGQGVLSTSIEVYKSKEYQNVTLVQQRSPVIQGHIPIFAKNLMNWSTSQQFKEILFVASTNANKRIDSQLTGNQLRFIKSNTISNETLDKIKLNNIPEMEVQFEQAGEIVQLSNRLTGLGKELYNLCNNQQDTNTTSTQNTPFLCFNLFCSEGDNTMESMAMAHTLAVYLDICKNPTEKIPFVTPPSWALLYGPSFDQSLYF